MHIIIVTLNCQKWYLRTILKGIYICIYKEDLSAGHQCPHNWEFVTKKGSNSSNQGQEVGHTIDFSLYVHRSTCI